MTKSDLEQLIEKHGNDIYRFCFHLTGCRYDADDLYQDTLCKAYEIRKRIEQTDDGPDLIKVRTFACISFFSTRSSAMASDAGS